MSHGAYIRVSTDKQDHRSQKHAINTYLANHGIDRCLWFEDTITGSAITRDGMDGLNRAIFMGEVKTVVTWKLDRIARDMKTGINLLTDWCDKGVRVVSITEQVDLSGPMGRMLVAILFSLAEIERNNIRERVRAGMKVAIAKGHCKGRKPGTYVASPMRAKELRMKGLKYHEISTSLGVSMATVFRYMKME
jgi:DNA invertase Pin-like site-specific DNA recombinase